VALRCCWRPRQLLLDTPIGDSHGYANGNADADCYPHRQPTSYYDPSVTGTLTPTPTPTETPDCDGNHVGLFCLAGRTGGQVANAVRRGRN